jgi:hypothetical protein
MTRINALSDDKWFALADELVTEGTDPTVRGLADRAKSRFGIGASFTTIGSVLTAWRRMGGGARVTGATAAFSLLIERAAEPLFKQLVEEAAANHAPLLAEADGRALEAESRAERLDAELKAAQFDRDQLAHENSSLRAAIEVFGKSEALLSRQLELSHRESAHVQAILDAAEKRWAEGKADYLARLKAAEAQNLLLLQSRKDDDSRYANLLTTITKLRDAS